MRSETYGEKNAKALRFPICGIGTGGIMLSGVGTPDLYCMFGKREKRFFRFALRADSASGKQDVRFLNVGDERTESECFSFTPFVVRFPYARLNFSHRNAPCKPTLCAFNPFLPLNHIDSSIPAAFFEWEICNTADENVSCTLCAAVENPLPNGINRFDGDIRCDMKALVFSSESDREDDGALQSFYNAKNMCIATDCDEVSYTEYADLNGSEESLLSLLGGKMPLKSNACEKNKRYNPSIGLLCAHISLAAGEKKTVRFVFAHYMRHAIDKQNQVKSAHSERVPNNFYCRFFSSSKDCAAYCFLQWERLKNETDKFTCALYDSTLPEHLSEALCVGLSALKSPCFAFPAEIGLCADGSLEKIKLPPESLLTLLFGSELCRNELEYEKITEYFSASKHLLLGEDEEAFSLINDRKKKSDDANNPFADVLSSGDALDAMTICSCLNAVSGYRFYKSELGLAFSPLLRFSDKDGYFKCIFGCETAYGTIEAGPKYVEMKILRGELTLKSFGIFAEPKLLYFGGRKLDFHAQSNFAVLDFTVKCTPEKGITVIYD